MLILLGIDVTLGVTLRYFGRYVGTSFGGRALL